MKTSLFISTTAILGAMVITVMGQPKSNDAFTKTKTKMSTVTNFKTITVDGLSVFYRVAGDKNNPAILFLHGFPSSSHMYRDVMNDLAGKYYVIAPDYPGFGQSDAPSGTSYDYTFDTLSKTVEHFIDAIGLKKFSLYMQDYGGPVGLRIAARRPELIQALIIQNANAYNEGLGDALQPLVAYIRTPTTEAENAVRTFLTAETTKWQYTDGAEDVTKINPDAYVVDQYYLDRKGNDQIQLALFRNYGTNMPKYEEWHQYFRKHQPPALIVWGKNDKLFIAPGADAYKKDLPKAEVHLMNGGHFLLEEHHTEVAGFIDGFLARLK